MFLQDPAVVAAIEALETSGVQSRTVFAISSDRKLCSTCSCSMLKLKVDMGRFVRFLTYAVHCGTIRHLFGLATRIGFATGLVTLHQLNPWRIPVKRHSRRNPWERTMWMELKQGLSRICWIWAGWESLALVMKYVQFPEHHLIFYISRAAYSVKEKLARGQLMRSRLDLQSTSFGKAKCEIDMQVPYYQLPLALQGFKQTMQKKAISPT